MDLHQLAAMNGYEIQPWQDDFEHGWAVYNEDNGFYAETHTEVEALNIVEMILAKERKQLGL